MPHPRSAELADLVASTLRRTTDRPHVVAIGSVRTGIVLVVVTDLLTRTEQALPVADRIRRTREIGAVLTTVAGAELAAAVSGTLGRDVGRCVCTAEEPDVLLVTFAAVDGDRGPVVVTGSGEGTVATT